MNLDAKVVANHVQKTRTEAENNNELLKYFDK